MDVAPTWLRRTLLTALLAWCAAACPEIRAAVSATVDKAVLNFGETLTLSITFDGNRAGQPQLPAIPGFNVVGSGTRFELNNNQMSQTFTYEMQPTQPGDLMIPAFQLNVGGQIQTTQPIKVKILKPGENQPGGAPANAFLRVVVPKTNVVVGEVMEVDVQVYFLEGRITQYPQFPVDPGVTLGKWLKPTESRVAVNNQAYSMVSFKVPVTVVKAGQLTLGPATENVQVPDRQRRADFFFGQPTKNLPVTSEKVLLTAVPLPMHTAPATFAGAVGQYSLNVTASPTNVAVGDPVTVRVQIAGRGWLDGVSFPPQPAWREFKSYAPNSRIDGGGENNVSGTKTFEVAVVPGNADIKMLPPFEFTFFDPESRVFRTLKSAAIPLNVQAAVANAMPMPAPGGTNKMGQAAPDLAHIKLRLGTATANVPLITQGWFIALQAVAPALWLGLLIRRKIAESDAGNPRLRRRREVEKRVNDALKHLRAHAAGNQSDEFFATLFRALQEQIGERLDVPASSITEALIDERLRPAGLADESCRALHELFQAANLARYSPVKSAQELSALLTRAEGILRELRDWEGKP
jgi:hypothetical protein